MPNSSPVVDFTPEVVATGGGYPRQQHHGQPPGRPQITALSNGGFVVTRDQRDETSPDTGAIAVRAQVFSAWATAVEQIALSLKRTCFTVSDPDAGDVPTVTLSTSYGLLSATAGTSGAVVSGSGTGAVTLTGTASQIAALLNTDGTSTVSFMAKTDTPLASATITLAANDGAGGTASTNLLLPIEDKAEFAGTGGPSVGFTPVVVRTGGEILVNTTTAGFQAAPQITPLPNGGFVVIWDDSSAASAVADQAAPRDVRAQVFTAAGAMVGTEIVVNTTLAGDQFGPQITTLSNGGLVATWWGNVVQAQVFTAAGEKVGAEIQVSIGGYSEPQITALSNGGFVVTWTDNSRTAPDTDSYAVRAQVFSAVGAMIGTNFLVNTTTDGYQGRQQITALLNGGFVVTWQTYFSVGQSTVWAQVFSDTSAKVGAELNLGAAPSPGESHPQIAPLSSGGFVVTWQDNAEVSAQIFDAVGTSVGPEILVNTATAGSQNRSQIAALSNGGFVVTWTDGSLTAPDTNGDAVRAQVFTAAGARVGTEILVNTATTGNQETQQITALSNGGFVITWEDVSRTEPDSSTAVRAQVFSASGVMVGTEILVNTATSDQQFVPQITALQNGGFVVTWQDRSATAPDIYGLAVRAQVFNVGPSAVEQVALSLKNTGFTVSDPDANDVLTVTLSTTYGLLSATAGTSGAVVAGSGTGALTLTGTAAQIAALLNTDGSSSVSFLANTDTPPVSATITLTADDGSGGSGGTASTSLILPIEDTGEFINGTVLADSLTGTNGADSIDGGGGNDFLNGGAGDDMLIGGAGNDTLNGGDGFDTASYAGASSGVRVSLSTAAAQAVGGGAGSDTLVATENLTGSSFGDALTGNALANALAGGLGADKLYGMAGIDTLTGGAGNDTLDGGTGADVLSGGADNDIYIVDNAGDQTIELASAGYDIVRTALDGWILADNIEALQLQGIADIDGAGNAGANNLQGNAGANSLDGGAGVDTINGNDGDDVIIGGLGNDLLRGGTGADTFVVRQESIATPVLETDQVYDFDVQDIIDLSAIDANTRLDGNQAFVLVGAFTKPDAAHDADVGQMTLTFAGGITTLRLDVNGDGKVDYQMKINGDVTGDSGGWVL